MTPTALITATALHTAGAPNLESYPVAAGRRRLRPRLWIFPPELRLSHVSSAFSETRVLAVIPYSVSLSARRTTYITHRVIKCVPSLPSGALPYLLLLTSSAAALLPAAAVVRPKAADTARVLPLAIHPTLTPQVRAARPDTPAHMLHHWPHGLRHGHTSPLLGKRWRIASSRGRRCRRRRRRRRCRPLRSTMP